MTDFEMTERDMKDHTSVESKIVVLLPLSFLFFYLASMALLDFLSFFYLASMALFIFISSPVEATL